MSTIFTPKTPSETGPFVFDYTRLLKETEIITSATVTCAVIEGTDPSAPSMISGSALVIQNLEDTPGKAVAQKVINGVVGNRYKLSCKATTNSGYLIEIQGDFYVLEQVVQ